MVNARSETAARKTSFRESWKSHRCVIPASWYFEWEHLLGTGGKKKTGAKYLIQPRGAGMTWLAGLYRLEDDLPVFTVLTREPAESIRFIHDRMPLILGKEHINAWMDPESDPGFGLRRDDQLFGAVPDARMRIPGGAGIRNDLDRGEF